jgi:exopolysaccharide biosynthesis predicted pyruvyltransferase EpsI
LPLLKKDEFALLFEPLQGKRVGFVQLNGNAGDNLIHAATLHLFRSFEINAHEIKSDRLDDKSIADRFDEIVISGGANIGSLYPQCVAQRQAVLAHDLPTTIFPQSFTSEDEDISSYKQVYVREKTSLKIDPSLILAPDLALGYEDVNTVMTPEFETGLFLREDVERKVADDRSSICDPASICWQPTDYLNLASQFAHIYTDRLHFAIAALITGRQATLLPNTYYKNRAMYDTWLADLGCHWLDDPSGIDFDRKKVIEKLWPRLAGVPNWGPAWASIPDRKNGDLWEKNKDRLQLIDKEGNERLKADESTQMIWNLCDGQRDIYSIAKMIGDAYQEQRVQIAGDVRNTINTLCKSSAMVLNRNDSTDRTSIRLEQLEDFRSEGWYYRQARLVYPFAQERRLWFSVPEEYASCLDKRVDSFVIATLMDAMYRDRPLQVVGGKISASLANHLQVFQTVWDAWRKDYQAVNLDVELVDDIDIAPSKRPLLAFSGGLDSAYSSWKLKNDPAMENFAALMVHGLDIPLTDQPGFDNAFLRARKMLDPIDVELIPMRTNFRAVHGDQHWEYRHATGIAGALTLLQGSFSSGIISSTLPNTMQSFWGSNPTTDPLLGSRGFPINHYGDEAPRLEKFKQLRNWKDGLDNLRVCWQGLEHDRNCGHCNKCLMTRLSLFILELKQNCFNDTMTAEEIVSCLPNEITGRMGIYDMRQVIEEAHLLFSGDSWLKEIEQRYACLLKIKTW